MSQNEIQSLARKQLLSEIQNYIKSLQFKKMTTSQYSMNDLI